MTLKSYNMGNVIAGAFRSNRIYPQDTIESSGVKSFTCEETMRGEGLDSDLQTLDVLRNDARNFELDPHLIAEFEYAYYGTKAKIWHC